MGILIDYNKEHRVRTPKTIGDIRSVVLELGSDDYWTYSGVDYHLQATHDVIRAALKSPNLKRQNPDTVNDIVKGHLRVTARVMNLLADNIS